MAGKLCDVVASGIPMLKAVTVSGLCHEERPDPAASGGLPGGSVHALTFREHRHALVLDGDSTHSKMT